MSSAITNRNYYLIIDKSGSMCERDMPGGFSRWDAVSESAFAIASKIIDCGGPDSQGITLYTFSSKFKHYPYIKTPNAVKKIFQENEPCGGTKLAEVLDHALKDYFSNKAVRKTNGATVLVVTDGVPDNKTLVAQQIVQATTCIQNPTDLAISFIQVGHDSAATEYLKVLDTQLSGARFDIVSTFTTEDLEDRGLTDILNEAIFQQQK